MPALAQITEDDYIPADPLQAQLGQLLFYDKILSGNKNISFGTCHHHDLAGGDGLSLGIGEGGNGIGSERTAGIGPNRIVKRIPRNAPALWNLGHRDVHTLFHDGRLMIADTYGNGFNSPAEEWLPQGLDNIVAAQALFPLTAQFEMSGNPRENEIAGAIHDRIDTAWPILAKRVRTIPEYGNFFVQAFDHNEIAGAIHDRIDTAWPILAKRVRTIPEYGNFFVQAFDHIDEPRDVTIVEIGNALAAFITAEWRSFDSPYDAWLDGAPLPDAAERGRVVFFNSARCAACHAGPLFTDQGFHALGLPAFGPGRTRLWDPMPRDLGRMGKTNLIEIDEPRDVTIVEIGNALAAFITAEWRSFDSPYDAWLDGAPLPDAAERGRVVFFNSARCAACHAGPLFTDQGFHALGLPAFGPGRTRLWDPMPRDLGRMGKTNLIEDAYKFRTPSLRNVALTGPYGHNGAFPTLRSMIAHHADPIASRATWTQDMAGLPEVPWLAHADFVIQQDQIEMARQALVGSETGFDLSQQDISDLEAFLRALTGATAPKQTVGQTRHRSARSIRRLAPKLPAGNRHASRKPIFGI